MAEILHPGVFVEEVATGAKPIEGVSTSTAAFIGETRVSRQRLVYQTLAEELATRVHALSLTTLAPDEEAP